MGLAWQCGEQQQLPEDEGACDNALAQKKGQVEAKGDDQLRVIAHELLNNLRDTADFLIDLGLYQYAYTALRVIGVDTPELVGVPAEVKAAGLAAKARTTALLLDRPALLDTRREKRSFERFVGRVWLPRPDDLAVPPAQLTPLQVGDTVFVDLAEVLIAEGHGKPIPG